MNYKITELYMSQNFQGLYIGKATEKMKIEQKEEIISKVSHMFPDKDSYEDWTEDFPTKPLKDGKFNVMTYGNIIFAVIDFSEDPDTERDADWATVNIMFNYYPSLGETIEEIIDKKLKEKTYNTHPCYF